LGLGKIFQLFILRKDISRRFPERIFSSPEYIIIPAFYPQNGFLRHDKIEDKFFCPLKVFGEILLGTHIYSHFICEVNSRPDGSLFFSD
jgi:hypothetical protein